MSCGSDLRRHDLREISTDAGVLRYHEAGDGAPLLFLHGSGPGVTGWRNFRGVLRHLRRALPLPGPGVPRLRGQRRLRRSPDDHRTGRRRHRSSTGSAWTGSTSSATRWAAGSASTSPSSNPDRVGRLVTIGGIGTNVFSPGPSEGIRLLQEFTEDPTRQRLVDWLHSMVYDPALVTEELIEERWALATDPERWRAPAACTARRRSRR